MEKIILVAKKELYLESKVFAKSKVRSEKE